MKDQGKNLPTAKRVLLGEIVGAHGIRGDIVVRSFTAEPEAIAAYGPLQDASGSRLLELRAVRITPKGVVARVAGVADRTAAEALKGTELYIDRVKLPKTDAAEFYHADLIGLEARDASGKRTGEIVDVANFGAGDLLEVRFANASDTQFIPFSDACVPEVDVAAGFAVIVPPVMTGELEPAEEAGGGEDDAEG